VSKGNSFFLIREGKAMEEAALFVGTNPKMIVFVFFFSNLFNTNEN
jgi:hypothetical protein